MKCTVALALASFLFLATLAPSAEAAEFRLGFAALASQLGATGGVPVENEHYGPNGDSLQRTTTGLMVWRKADNWTTFTDGTRTWISGPEGVQERGNDERFPWEADDRHFSLQIIASTPFDTAAEEAALAMVNGSRAQHGIGPVAMDGALRQVARAHSKDMGERNYFAHNSPEGRSPFDRMRAGGVGYGWAAENLGYGKGYGSNTDAARGNHQVMMAETPPNDGHRQNILNSRFKKVGIGVYRTADGRTYYCCDFTD